MVCYLRRMRFRYRYLLVALAALLAIGTGLWQLDRESDGLVVTHERAGTIPLTLFRPATGKPAPVVVIAHGFAGSQQLMQPFATTLARNGYIAVTFDFPGHGQNPLPLPGGLAEHEALSGALEAALATVVGVARRLPQADGQLALLGHSMASDVVARYAQKHAEVGATVAVSLYFPDAVPDSPRNLLIIDGALEPAALINEASRVVALTSRVPVQEGVTYGNFADGSARHMVLAPAVEHIGVLYSGRSLAETLDWLNRSFGRSEDGFIATRGLALGLLYLGVVALAWPLSRCLPRVVLQPAAAGYRWRELPLISAVPMILTPLLLWKAPTEFMPILLGDYLMLHFGLYGLLTLAAMVVFQRGRAPLHLSAATKGRLAFAALAVAAYGIFAVGMATHQFAFNFMPGPGRMPLVLALLGGTLPYFLSDEWLTRGGTAACGAYPFTKACFLLSLALAILLNPARLFFLVIIVPMILAFFVIYGLFSAWAWRRTGQPLVAGLANAWIFAWAIAATFPVIGGPG